jgi:hypothetical protein
MATPLPCDNHPDQMAAVLITNLENGETLTLCVTCMFEWAAVLTAVEDQGIAPTEEPPGSAEEVGQPVPAEPEPVPDSKSESPALGVTQAHEEIDATPAQETEAAGE